jgi:serine/threonine protein kinase
MVTVGDDPLLGVVVEGRYKIESVIGQGSAGTVYKAIQELIGREVAIKVLHDYLVSDQEFIKRFTQEAKASSRLSHPNIITIYDFGVIPQGGRPYIAMDLLKGTPLSDYIADKNHIPAEDALPLFKQVCSALAEAHRQGVVHRDIKPENIVLVERSGQKLFPIVVDFGIARLVQEESDVARITRTGTVCGSPTYMSPEQCMSSKVDHRSDIYSLGIVIYETLTGEVPFLSDELVKVMAMQL